MKSQLHAILFIDNKFIRNRFRDDFFKKFYPFLYEKIDKNPILSEYSFKEKIYIIYHGIDNQICKICNNKTNLISFSKGFYTYCSKQCIQKDEEIKNKVKATNIRKFGVDHPQKALSIREKTKKTVKIKYGVDSILQSEEVKDKIKKTNLKKYGFENPFQSEEVKDKIKKTNLKKYGVEHNSYSEDVVEKRKNTFLVNYGVDNPNKNPNIIKKRNETIVLTYVKKYSKILDINEKDIITTSNGLVIIRNLCNNHKSFKIDKQNLFNRIRYGIENICTKCNPIAETSTIKENEIVDFIKSLNVNYIRNDRKILNGKEIDIYLPDNKLGIEFNGLYWHSNRYCNRNYHLNKTETCKKLGIQLLHVFEDEWIFKKEVVKSVIKSKLGIINNRIFARKTEIKEINDNNLIREFLNNNHLQGFVGSKVKIGLFYNNELVSLMTFGKKRIALGNKTKSNDEYEMLRFCNKLNTQVIGGVSRMLNYFQKTYNPNSILTFADRRYSDGNLYKKMGFNFILNTKPNYWYFKRNELIRYHRYKFRKDVLIREGFSANKSENEIMGERGFFKIHDCGNVKYILIEGVNKEK